MPQEEVLLGLAKQAITAEDSTPLDWQRTAKIQTDERIRQQCESLASTGDLPSFLLREGRQEGSRWVYPLNDPIKIKTDEGHRYIFREFWIDTGRNIDGQRYGLQVDGNGFGHCSHLGHLSDQNANHAFLSDGRLVSSTPAVEAAEDYFYRIPLIEHIQAISPRNSNSRTARFFGCSYDLQNTWQVPNGFRLDVLLNYDDENELGPFIELKQRRSDWSDSLVIDTLIKSFVSSPARRFELNRTLESNGSSKEQMVFPFRDAAGEVIQLVFRQYDAETQSKYLVPCTTYRVRNRAHQSYYCMGLPGGQQLLALDKIADATDESLLLITDSIPIATAINRFSTANIIGTSALCYPNWEHVDLDPVVQFPNKCGIYYLIVNHSLQSMPGVVLLADVFRQRLNEMGINLKYLILEVKS